MKVYTRTEFGNPILRKKAKNVPLSFLKTAKFKLLKRRMIYTMRQINGVGLAAPQVGESLNIFVIETRPTPNRVDLEKRGPFIVVNPKIKTQSRKDVFGWEACLSFRGAYGSVPRSERLTVEYRNGEGEKIIENMEGFWARIFQHEIDHLNGILYVDRIKDMKTMITKTEFEKRVLKKKK